MSRARTLTLLSALLACTMAAGALDVGAAQGQSTWRLEQPVPPPPEGGAEAAPAAVGLGRVGDIEFSKPNRGVLITAGNPPTIPPGVWIYNGQNWRELAIACGASDGRIAWVPPEKAREEAGHGEEFWTVSDGRGGEVSPQGVFTPLIDDTLCRFGEGKILESFASPVEQPSSYQRMSSALCVSPVDCWFGGEALPLDNPQVGAFQLHWNGSGLEAAPYFEEGHAIEAMQQFNGRLYESVRVRPSCSAEVHAACDPVSRQEPFPPPVHVLTPPGGFSPENRLNPDTLYATGELPEKLDYLRLSAGESSLWAATGLRPEELKSSEAEQKAVQAAEHPQATVLRFTSEARGTWKQLLGPETSPTGETTFPKQTVEALAAEPGTGETGEESAWLALQSNEEAKVSERGEGKASTFATVARIAKNGTVSRQETLPSAEAESGVGPKGAAELLTCPAPGDCWMVTTKGWLFHLAPEGERTLKEDTESGYSGVIAQRPEDRGLPQQLPDSVPPEEGGQLGEAAAHALPTVSKGQEEVRIPVALVSGVHAHVVRGTTLELRFHLAAKARVQLLAKRKHRLVAKSPAYVFNAGSRKILLRLDRKRWPTELHLVEHALAPLPTVSANAGVSETVTTSSLAVPLRLLKDALVEP